MGQCKTVTSGWRKRGGGLKMSKEASSVEDTIERSAIKLALEALQRIDLWLKARYQVGLVGVELDAIKALEEALASEQEQRSDNEHLGEPVARVHTFIGSEWAVVQVLGQFNLEDEFYTKPQPKQEHGYPKEFQKFEAALKAAQPKREWVGLTDDDWDEVLEDFPHIPDINDFKKIEARLKELNA